METFILLPGIHEFTIDKPVLAGNTTQRKHVFNRSATTISSGGFRALRAGGTGVAIILLVSIYMYIELPFFWLRSFLFGWNPTIKKGSSCGPCFFPFCVEDAIARNGLCWRCACLRALLCWQSFCCVTHRRLGAHRCFA